MKKLLLLITAVFLFNISLQAQTWVQGGGPFGGNITDLVYHSGSDKVFALANGALFVSPNGSSLSWTYIPLTAPNGDQINDLYIDVSGNIFVLSSTALFKSTDAGVTFTQLNPASAFQGGLRFGITSVNYVVLGTDAGVNKIWRSTDNGITWTKASAALSSNAYDMVVTHDKLLVAEFNSPYVERSDTYGNSWATKTTLLPVGPIGSISISADGTKVYCVTNSDLFESTSDGDTWSSIKGLTITDLNINGSPASFLASFDTNNLFFVDNNNHKLYTKAQATAATSWTLVVASNFISAAGFNGVAVSGVAFKSATNIFFGSKSFGVLKTTNGGSTIIDSNTGLVGMSFNGMVNATNNNLLVSTSSGIFLSTDHGVTWSKPTALAGNLSPNNFNIFKAATGAPNTIVAVGNGFTYTSNDNGVNNWVQGGGTPGANSFATQDGTAIFGYSFNSQTIYYSADQGATWSNPLTVSGLGGFQINKLVIDQNKVAYAIQNNSNSIYKIALNNYATSAGATSATATAISIASTAINNGLSDITYLNNKIYILGNSSSTRILGITSNAGANWTAKTAPSANGLNADLINNYLLLTSFNGTSFSVSISRDDGDTYVASTLGVNSTRTQIYNAIIDQNGIAYALLSNFGIYKTSATVVTPAAPSALTNSGASSDRITLSWTDNATSETYFVVQKFNGVSYDSVGTYSTLSGTGKKGFVEIKNLTPNTSYQFQVAAANTAGKSAYAQLTTSTTVLATSTFPDNVSWTGTVKDGVGTTLSSLTNIAIKALGGGNFSISDINNNAGVASSVSPTVVPATFIESNGGVYLSPVLVTTSPNNKYLFSNTAGTWNGTNTLTLSWVTDASYSPQTVGNVTLTHSGLDPIPAPPSNTTAFVYNNTGIEVTWIGSAFETQYLVERSHDGFSTTDGAPFPVTVTYPATTYVDNNSLVLNTTYSYRVSAKNATGTSAVSNVASVQFTKPRFALTAIPNAATIVSTTSSISGGGGTWGDFNNDGFDDLIMPQLSEFSGIAAYPLMFKNNGTGGFSLVTTSSGMDLSLYLMATAGDYDNDGNLDVFFTSSGSQNYLYKGHGDFTFTKVVSPVTENIPNQFQSASDIDAAWVDYNNDGLVDLYVVPSKNIYPSKLFTQGPVGIFTKATTGTLATLTVKSLTSIWADFDNDGDQDVFVMDQATGSTNQLLKNNGGGTFVQVPGPPFSTDLSGNDYPNGAAWGDYNNDTFLDLYIGTGVSSSNLFYKNNGDGTFTKQSVVANSPTEVKGPTVSTSAVAWGDVNNDGFLDLIASNFGGSSQIYINNNGSSFTKISNEKLNDNKINHLGASFSDYDNDGFLDLAMAVVDPQLFSGGSTFGGVKNQLFKNNTAAGTSTNWVEFKLKGTTSNRSAIGARITLNASNGTHQIREINSSTTFASASTQTVHFGLGANTISSVVIKWPSGVVMTVNNAVINQINTITEDGTPPAVTLLNPLNAATGVAAATPIEITFNDVPVPVAGKKINVFPHGSATAAFSANVTAGTPTGNKISFTPSPVLNFLTQYDVVVDAGAFADIYGNAIATTITWSFTTIDNIPPTITFTPITSLIKGFAPSTFSVTSTDNSGTVSSVVMSYRKVSTKAFTDLAGTFNTTTQKWDFTVLPTFFDETGMNYYFTAKDPSNNTAMLPATSTPQKYFVTRLKFTAAAAPALTIVKGTGNVSGYQIISIPWEIANKDIASNFDELGGGDKTKYRFLRYHETPTPGWDEYPGTLSSFARGQGYFINQTVTNTITLLDGDAPKEDRDSLFVLSLTKGWNEIGNPYLSAIQWNDVLAYNNIATGVGKLVLYGGTKYNAAADPGVLQPYLGGFVLADNAVAALKIPFQGQTSGGRSIQYDLTGEIADDSWQVNFQLKQNDLEFGMMAVGMSPNANTGKDIFDMAVPPRVTDDFIEMSVAHPEYFMKRLAGDVVNTQSDYTWEFNVGSSVSGLAELSWDNTKFGDNRKDLYLFDVALQKPINMRQVSTYSFDPAQSDKIKVIFGDDLETKVKPDRVFLGQAYPNPASTVAVIPFTLPDNNAAFQVRLEVYDMLGRKIGNLVDGSLTPGFYQSEWRTTDSNANGLYTYRLVVSGGNNQDVQSGKMLLKK